MTQLDMGSRVSQSLCWPAGGQGRGLAGPGAGSGLLWAGWVGRLQNCDFVVSGVCSLVGEPCPEAKAGFLEGRASACLLVGGTVSWTSGQGCV